MSTQLKSKDIVFSVFDVLSFLASTIEPVLMGYRDPGAYESYNEYEAYRKMSKESKLAEAKKFQIESVKYHRYQQSVKNLMKSQCIIENSKGSLELTEKGWLKFMKQSIHVSSSNNGKNIKYYLIVFDVPEQYRRIRDLLRRSLIATGFEMLQKSIFLTCDKRAYQLARIIITRSDIKEFVNYIEADKIE